MTKSIKPEDLNWVTAFLTVNDANQALDFYTNVFGFKEHQRVPDKNGKIMFARLTHNGSNFVILPPSPFREEKYRGVSPLQAKITSPVTLYVYCNDLDNKYKKAVEYGLKIIMEPEVRFWGDKTFRVEDPNGYIWDFATWVANFNPSKLPPELL